MANLTCKNCGKEMKLDDKEVRFEGNRDNYWLCDCGTGCFEKIRFGKSHSKDWSEPEEEIVLSLDDEIKRVEKLIYTTQMNGSDAFGLEQYLSGLKYNLNSNKKMSNCSKKGEL